MAKQMNLFRIARPTRKSVEPEYVECVIKQINNWIGDDAYKFDERDQDKLIGIILNKRYFDGYQMCRELERVFAIDPDSNLVDILNDVVSLHDDLFDKAIKDWVIANNIVPLRRMGEKVNLDGVHGWISDIDFSRGYYTVSVSAVDKLNKIPFERFDSLPDSCLDICNG